MKVRALKRRHDTRTLHRWRFLADLRAELTIEDWPDDWDEGDDDGCDGPACGHCGAGTVLDCFTTTCDKVRERAEERRRTAARDNVAGNRLAEGKSGLTRLLAGCFRRERNDDEP